MAWSDALKPLALALLLMGVISATGFAGDDDDDDEDETPPVATLAAPSAEGVSPTTVAAAPPRDNPARAIRLQAGLGAYILPRYPGARRSQAAAFPLVQGGIGEWLSVDTLDGVRVTAFERDGLSLGLAARYRFGRRRSDDPNRLRGLSNVNDTVELGGFASYQLGQFTFDAIVTQDVARAHRGLVADLGVYHTLELGWVEMEFGPFLRLASRSFNQSFFGISAPEAANNGRPAFNVTGGLNRVGVNASMTLPLTERLSLIGDLEYGRLVGRVQQSPIVRHGGSANQTLLGIFLAWRF